MDITDLLSEVYRLRRQHFPDADIAELLNIDEERIEECESSISGSIGDVVQRGIFDIGKVAAETDLPVYLVFQIAANKGLQLEIDRFNKSLIIQERNEERNWQIPQYKRKRERPKKVIEKIKPAGLITTSQGEKSKRQYTHAEPQIVEKKQKKRPKKGYVSVADSSVGTGVIKQRGRPKTETARQPTLDEMIKQGYTLEQMAKVMKYAGENVRRYINRTNQYTLWRTAREKLKLEEKQRKKFIGSILSSVVPYLYNRSNRAEQKAFEYLSKHHTKRITYNMLVIVYTRYFEALGMGKKLSLSKLGEGSKLYPPEIGKILSDVGLEPLYGKRDRVVTPKDKKEAIKRAFSLDIRYYDIAYFLDIPWYVVTQYMARIGTRPRTQKWILPKLSYRLASQIYQAKDLRFKNGEIKELLGTTIDIVEYALKHESTIAPKIINALRILYPNKNITTPYNILKD